MSDCTHIDSLVTPYIDNELAPSGRVTVDEHLQTCPSCRSRVAVERAVRELMQTHRPALVAERASELLRARLTRSAAPPVAALSTGPPWRTRLAPLAMAATLVLIVGAAFVYQATQMSTRLMAAELTADHVKCFMMNSVLGTNHSHEAVEEAMASRFAWPVELPSRPESAGLELVGSRPCLYGQGRVAHIMYRYNGRPVSVFMLPDTTRREEAVAVLGHEAAIWSAGNRTFVLVANEPRAEVQRLASFVHAAMR